MSGDVLIGSAGTAELARRLRQVPVEARRTTTRALRKSGDRVLRSAQANAAWSSRIPASLTLQVRFAGRYPGVIVAARASQAPHARPYEGITGASQFKHPVFGGVWVAQATRPFLRPAVADAGPELADELSSAMDEAARKSGL